MSNPLEVLLRLSEVIADRRRNRPANSYTTRLFDGGTPQIGAKVLEEAAELVDAAGRGGASQVVHETADLLYHILVLLAASDVTLVQVAEELERRFGTSGLDEKDRRAGTVRGTVQ